jgi:hypothetical protein
MEEVMNPNLGIIDRAIRVLVGAIVLSLVFVGPTTAWGYLGLVPIATAVWSFSPLYRVFGISTCKAPHSA